MTLDFYLAVGVVFVGLLLIWLVADHAVEKVVCFCEGHDDTCVLRYGWLWVTCRRCQRRTEGVPVDPRRVVSITKQWQASQEVHPWRS